MLPLQTHTPFQHLVLLMPRGSSWENSTSAFAFACCGSGNTQFEHCTGAHVSEAFCVIIISGEAKRLPRGAREPKSGYRESAKPKVHWNSSRQFDAFLSFLIKCQWKSFSSPGRPSASLLSIISNNSATFLFRETKQSPRK
jgi:hypothetical protein